MFVNLIYNIDGTPHKRSQEIVENSFELIDCQQDTNHMKSMGAEIMGTSDFLNFLEKNKLYPQANDFWKNYSNQNPIL